MPADAITNDESRWAAVLGRDGTADGGFVYAVASTGIYCRPSCPSRRPRRNQVRFFSTPDAAETEGFRACLRCEPRKGEPDARRRVREAQEYLDRHLDETVTLERLGAAVGLSPYHLQRSFRRQTGMSPKAYADARRMERMKSGLRSGRTVSRATYDAGYTSASRAYDHARARIGMTPAAYRRGGAGLRIRFVTLPTSLGTLLDATTDRGLCTVTLGDSADALERGLRQEFPAATIEPADDRLREWAAAVVDRVEGAGRATRLPLDPQGTAFQLRVWEELQRIPAGATRSYSEVARAIGKPAAARAVAAACAGNRLAVVVPCHRVVRETGELGGYRWGVERKRAILEREQARSTAPDRAADSAPARRRAQASSPR
jgi:AraC family transcriptional regulator of adaptative response/methylated-DNA-[protein]-cysteine methyltransferase